MFTAILCFALGALFWCIGIWSSRQQKAVCFYAGIKIKPDSIRDIPLYNRACGRLWKGYSLLWLSCGFAGVWLGTSMWMFILLVLAAVPGSLWLLLKFNRIQRQYAAP